MTQNTYKTSRSLCFLALSLICIFTNHKAIAAPQPVPPAVLYRGNSASDESSQADLELEKMLNKIHEEFMRNLEKEKNELEVEKSHIEEPMKEQDFSSDPDVHPEFETVQKFESGSKRNVYGIALCHFKICNIGRKRE